MGNSLVVQWLGLTAFSARAQGTKILLAVWCGPTSQKKSKWTSLSLFIIARIVYIKSRASVIR